MGLDSCYNNYSQEKEGYIDPFITLFGLTISVDIFTTLSSNNSNNNYIHKKEGYICVTTTVCYKEPLGEDIHPRAWMSPPRGGNSFF